MPKTHRPAPLPNRGQAGGTATADPQTAGKQARAKGPKLPTGASSWSTQFYIETTDRHGKTKLKLQATNGGVVPIDKGGKIAGRQYQCPRCEEPEWHPIKLVFPPACGVHQLAMLPMDGERVGADGDRFGWMFPDIPWEQIWDWGRERFLIAGGAAAIG